MDFKSEAAFLCLDLLAGGPSGEDGGVESDSEEDGLTGRVPSSVLTFFLVCISCSVTEESRFRTAREDLNGDSCSFLIKASCSSAFKALESFAVAGAVLRVTLAAVAEAARVAVDILVP